MGSVMTGDRAGIRRSGGSVGICEEFPMFLRMGLRTRRWFCVLVVTALVTGAPVRSEDDEADDGPTPSVLIAPARGSTQVPHPADRRWKLGERACTRDGRCGTVRMVTRDYAVVDVERAKPKSPPKRRKRVEESREDEVEERLPPPNRSSPSRRAVFRTCPRTNRMPR